MAFLLTGCLRSQRSAETVSSTPPPSPVNPSESYTLACPDVIEVLFDHYPGRHSSVPVNPDGTVDLGDLGSIRVDGRTPYEASQAIAERAHIPINRVQVLVAQHNSRKIFLFGQVTGEAHTVSYEGPETVVELLRRTEALTPDSAWNQVDLVRSHLADGAPAEVFHIDLQAILLHGDDRTNIRVQPLDEIYVGERTSSYFRRLVPTFLKPFYESFLSILPQPNPIVLSAPANP